MNGETNEEGKAVLVLPPNNLDDDLIHFICFISFIQYSIKHKIHANTVDINTLIK